MKLLKLLKIFEADEHSFSGFTSVSVSLICKWVDNFKIYSRLHFVEDGWKWNV